MMQGVPYPQFEKWFRSTRKEIVPIHVDGAPEQDQAPTKTGQMRNDIPERQSGSILVMVRSTNGFKIHQSGLDYDRPEKLIKLKVLRVFFQQQLQMMLEMGIFVRNVEF